MMQAARRHVALEALSDEMMIIDRSCEGYSISTGTTHVTDASLTECLEKAAEQKRSVSKTLLGRPAVEVEMPDANLLANIQFQPVTAEHANAIIPQTTQDEMPF